MHKWVHNMNVIEKKKKDCHEGVCRVFDFGGIPIYGGSRWDVKLLAFRPTQFYIDVGSDIIEELPICTPDMTRQYKKCPSYFRLYIPDMGVPDWGREDWDDLVLDIRHVRKTVIVSCLGGHGRTGLALSILAALTGACPADADPVKFVRERYCREAVESEEQIDYIAEIVGRKILSTPAKSFSKWYLGN